jgi:multidrug resistance protein, MATE family
VNLGSFYLVGIPVALFLGFILKMEGKGLWMGISCGSVVQFLLLAVITFLSNWQKMVCYLTKSAKKIRPMLITQRIEL